MDDSEKLAEIFLRNSGFTDVRYEPDGNVPPDFLADRRVAVEVRRLNQNYDDGRGKGLRGLEETAIPLGQWIRNYLMGLGPGPVNGQSWFVYYRFSRPTPPFKDLKQALDDLLLPFMKSADPQPFKTQLRVAGKFWITVFRAQSPMSTFFRLAGNSDEQSRGWLINEIEINLNHCIEEKTSKINSYQTKYKEWWLVLSDHIGYGLDDFDQKMFLTQASVLPGIFAKIILLDPYDATRIFWVRR